MLQLCFSVSFTVSVGCKSIGKPSQLHNHPCVRSSDPAVGIYSSSMGQTLGAIRPELTENHDTAAGLLRLLHRLGGLQVHWNTCTSYAHIHACALQSQLFAFMRAACVEFRG